MVFFRVLGTENIFPNRIVKIGKPRYPVLFLLLVMSDIPRYLLKSAFPLH